jgi:hypothetical protein
MNKPSRSPCNSILAAMLLNNLAKLYRANGRHGEEQNR